MKWTLLSIGMGALVLGASWFVVRGVERAEARAAPAGEAAVPEEALLDARAREVAAPPAREVEVWNSNFACNPSELALPESFEPATSDSILAALVAESAGSPAQAVWMSNYTSCFLPLRQVETPTVTSEPPAQDPTEYRAFSRAFSPSRPRPFLRGPTP